MHQEDIQQISNLLDKKFEENNKTIKEEVKLNFKEDIKVLKEEIVDEIGVIFGQSFNELESKINLIDKKISLVVNKDDKIVKKQQDFEIELKANLGAHDRLEEKIDSHEVRIKKLELPV